MDSEALHKIQVWAKHGTPKQFQIEIEAKIAPHGYVVAIEGNNLVCYKVEKKGGFIGIGARQTRQPVLRIIYDQDRVLVPAEDAAPEFVSLLASLLRVH
ncbi:MAG: hypothetical protein GX552_19310 [Chloroflexi bacterium]|jgi:hypothetical protein|nr:hypothetical protein [Chloroflexota bacterium]